MRVAPNSRARKRGKKMGSMEELKGRRRGILTTEKWSNPVTEMSHYMVKRVEWREDWAREVLE